MKKKILISILAMFVMGVLFSQESDNWYLSKTIVDIQFEGLEFFDESELDGIVKSYIGRPFSDSLSWDLQGRLYALEYFDFIIPEAHPGDSEYNTVILIFKVKEKPSIENVVFVGNSKITRRDLNDVILSTKNEIYNPSTLRADEYEIIAAYQEKGFMEVQVTNRIEEDEELNRVTIYFDIIEGVQTKISEILIEGNDFASDKTLTKLMDTKPSNLFNKGLLDENVLNEDISLIQYYYWERGYVDAAVVDVNREIIQNEETGINELVLTIVISEGDVYTYGGTQLVFYSGSFNATPTETSSIFTIEELQEKLYLEEEQLLNRVKFEADMTRIMNLYWSNGYIYNNFEPQEIRDEQKKTISYVLRIAEQDRAHIETITIVGNDKTKDWVIRRELPFQEGDVFSNIKIHEGSNRLYNTGLFSAIEILPQQGSQPGLMELVISVEEAQTIDVKAGMTISGGSSNFPIAGQISWKDKNFLGRYETFGISGTASTDRQSVSVEFYEPWLFGVRWGAGINLSYNHSLKKNVSQDIDGNGVPDPYSTYQEYLDNDSAIPAGSSMEYDSNYISLGINTGYTWTPHFARIGLSGGYETGFEYVTYDKDIYQPYSSTVEDNYNSWLYNDKIWIKSSFDTRDQIYNPTRGFIISEQLTINGIFPGSSKNYMKSVLRFGWSQKLFSIPLKDEKEFMAILDFNSAISHIFAKDGNSASLDLDTYGLSLDGMFVGRGWNPVYGGQTLWDNSLVIKFPIVQNILAIDIFYDFVGIWKSEQALNNISAADFRTTFGFGVRFDNPSFPIGIYLAKKWAYKQYPDGSWYVDWHPEQQTEIGTWDLVISFDFDFY